MTQTINPTYNNSNYANSTSIDTDIEQNKSTIASQPIRDKLSSQGKVFFSALKGRNYPSYKNQYTVLVNPVINKKIRQYKLRDKARLNLTNIDTYISGESRNYSSSVISQETSIFYSQINQNNADFQETINSLLELKEIDPDFDEDDEDEIYYPSDYAFSGSIELLTELYEILGNAFPYGFASVESRGGVDLIWKNKTLDKQVWFKFPVDDSFQSSVYYREKDKSNLIKQPEITFIAKLLQWLFTEDSFDTL